MTCRFAVSNIALPAYDHERELAELAGHGLEAVEIAPSRAWNDTWHGLGSTEVKRYRHQIEAAGLDVVGLHSLLYDQPELGLFTSPDMRSQTLEFLVHLSGVCRDLGGHTLIYGGGRWRGSVPAEAAWQQTVEFMDTLCRRIEDHGTCFCFEPLPPEDTDFLNSAGETLAMVEAVGHRSLRVQLDAKALVANQEAEAGTFQTVARHLVHFHANEPDLGVLGTSGTVDHATLGSMLRQIGYDGFVSIEQRQLSDDDPLGDVTKSVAVLEACYGGA